MTKKEIVKLIAEETGLTQGQTREVVQRMLDLVIDAMNLCPTGAILVRGESAALPFGDRQFDNETSRPDAEVLATKQAPSAPKNTKVAATEAKIDQVVSLHL